MSRRPTLIAVAALAALAALPSSAFAAIERTPGCVAPSDRLSQSDDGFGQQTAPPGLGFQVQFAGGQPYSDAFVSNNGYVSFIRPPFGGDGNQYPRSAEYTFADPSTPLVAPFLGDADSRLLPGGLEPVTFGRTTYEGAPAFCATWDSIGYHNATPPAAHADKRNQFQVIIVSRGAPGDFDLVYNYDQIAWETGDDQGGGGTGLGGRSASVGFADGPGTEDFTLPGSYRSGSFLDSNPQGLKARSRASAVPGRWVFQIRGGRRIPLEQDRIAPTVPGGAGDGTISGGGTGSTSGGTPVRISGKTRGRLSSLGRVRLRGSTLHLPVACSEQARGACSIRVRLTARISGRQRTIGTARRSRVQVGSVATLRVRLSSRARRVLRQRRTLSTTATIAVTAGGQRETLRPRLRLRTASR